MTSFTDLRTTLEEVFSATVQAEDELNYASATLILAGLLQIHARTPRYASHRARLESFPLARPVEIITEAGYRQIASPCPSPSELASAGFFHTGSGDETVCPACGLGLRDWQPSDQPAACHFAYSTAEASQKMNGDGHSGKSCPAMPCLYLVVHRWLTSELPLARKSLVPVGRVPSVCTLPGVVSRPVGSHGYGEFASLADRLRAIARIMSSPPSPQGWPVENARSLGHSDDLIVLALWRLQAETTGLGLACPAMNELRLDPQGTVKLLRAILRLQEELDTSPGDALTFDLSNSDLDDIISEPSDTELSAEDAETAALSRCRHARSRCPGRQSTNLPRGSTETVCKIVHLPHLYDYILWWSRQWPCEQ